MDTLAKLALGLIGHNRPRPLTGDASKTKALPAPNRRGGMPLMEALAARRSQRRFSAQPLDDEQMSDLLWAAGGVNRPQEDRRTAPSAMRAQEIDLYAALPDGLYCASAGLATVLRAWFDRSALSHAMGLTDDEQVLFAQTVGLQAP